MPADELHDKQPPTEGLTDDLFRDLVNKVGTLGEPVTAADAAIVSLAFDRMREFLEPGFQALTEQMFLFVDSFAGVAIDEYHKHHRRLPGSDRTSRLRKKRRSRVLNWFFNEHLPQQQNEAIKPC